MDMKRLAIGTIIGAVMYHLVNYLIVEVALADFYAANIGSATGAFRDATLQWAVALGSLSFGALLTAYLDGRAASPSIGEGFATGAAVCFAVWFHADFVIYGFTNLFNLTLTIADSVLSLITGGLAGAAIAAVIARVPKASAA